MQRERRAELVAHVREERGLRAVELGERLRSLALGLVGLGLADARRDLLADEAHERFVRLVERASRAQAGDEKAGEPLLLRALERNGERLAHGAPARRRRDFERGRGQIVETDRRSVSMSFASQTSAVHQIERGRQRRRGGVARAATRRARRSPVSSIK